jgi:hypothetical protein
MEARAAPKLACLLSPLREQRDFAFSVGTGNTAEVLCAGFVDRQPLRET